MKVKIAQWVIVLLLLGVITSNLLAQPTPLRPEGWLDAYPAPPVQPTSDPYPGPLPPDPYPAPVEPYPRLTIPARTPWPVIPTRTPNARATFAVTETRLRLWLLSPELYKQHRGSAAPTPTRDPEWEIEFETVHNRQPNTQDVKDRQWSLGFLSRMGRPPTDEEWIAHYYRRL